MTFQPAAVLQLLMLAAIGLRHGISTVPPQCPASVPKRACSGPRSPSTFLAAVANPAVYDLTERPPCPNTSLAGPTVVEVQLYVTTLNTVDTKLGFVTINGYLRSWWQDPRLAFNGTTQGGCMDAVRLPGAIVGHLWQPDLYIDNLVSQETNGLESLLEVYPDGRIWQSKQVLLTVKAKFNIGKLPFDSHVLRVIIASYSQDTTMIRLTSKGGDIGPGTSGLGLTAPALDHSTWQFVDENEPGRGFENAGTVSIKFGNWDYLELSLNIARKPKYHCLQVLLPAVLFLLVCYVQFFVDSGAAPARAALAVIPVLIMRTMGNAIYSSIPEGSAFMWLEDFVTTSMFLSVFAAFHFGVVQYCKLLEKGRSQKYQGLIKSKAAALKLIGMAKADKITLLSLMDKLKTSERVLDADELFRFSQAAQMDVVHARSAINKGTIGSSDQGESSIDLDVMKSDSPPPLAPAPAVGEKPQMPFGVHDTVRLRSAVSKEAGVTEAELLFLQYALLLFRKFDRDGSNHTSVKEIRLMLRYFNIYLTNCHVACVVAMFLRDIDHPTPVDEMQNHLRFLQFTQLLLRVDDYILKGVPHGDGFGPLARLVSCSQGQPPSEFADTLARVFFPVLVVMQILIFSLILPYYN